MTRKEAEVQMACFRQTFSSVRLLNEKAVLHAPQAHSKRTDLECRVLHEKRQLTTLDVTPQRAEQIFARYVEVDGEPCVLELVQDLQQDTPEAVVQRRQMLTQTGSMGEKLYRDALTGLYNRRYYEDALKKRSMEAGVAVLDMDGFKACNETYGHQAGDKMLEAAVGVMRHCVRRSDTIIRYGGDEFLLLLPHIEEATFQQKLQDICCQISETRLPGLEDIRLSVSIGGLINRGEPIDCAVARAEQLMMQAKKSRNAVVTDSEIAAEDIAPRKDTRPRMKILIVDDDNNIAELISLYLTKECFETKIVNDGELALKEFQTFRPNLILLDLMLPGIDGYQVCREIRHTSDVPIIMLSAKGEVFDKVLGLELGADDYIIKPFETKELVARVKAVLRRYHLPQTTVAPSENARCVTYPDLIVNLDNYSVTYDKKAVEMPPKELELLYFLASAPNQVFTREQLLDNIWGYDYIGDTRTVDVHIKRIREKIKDHDKWSIETVWGIGYKFVTK